MLVNQSVLSRKRKKVGGDKAKHREEAMINVRFIPVLLKTCPADEGFCAVLLLVHDPEGQLRDPVDDRRQLSPLLGALWRGLRRLYELLVKRLLFVNECFVGQTRATARECGYSARCSRKFSREARQWRLARTGITCVTMRLIQHARQHERPARN